MDPSAVADGIRRVLIARHDDEEDFTITTQDEMLDVMGRVLGIVSVAVGGIGGISLVVGAIGILTMMWISVNERTAEIGLAKAIGASRGQILRLYLLEATLLSLSGGLLGVLAGLGIARLLQLGIPGLPVETPMVYVVAALADQHRRRPGQRRAAGATRRGPRSHRSAPRRVREKRNGVRLIFSNK